jgi:hypothetical protein
MGYAFTVGPSTEARDLQPRGHAALLWGPERVLVGTTFLPQTTISDKASLALFVNTMS